MHAREMRVGTFMSGAAAVAVIGFLAFRIVDLEQRVSALSAQLGTPAEAPQEGARGRGDAGIPPAAPTGYAERLSALEKRVAALSDAQSALTKAPAQGREHQEEEILSVVQREGTRIRDVQLEWHRSRWLEGRAEQLNAFAKSKGLSPEQTAGLQGALQHEVDAMVDVLKRPELMEDPDQVASDWQAVLDDTDNQARKLLTPTQNIYWTQARVFERAVLWPWLPKKAAAGSN
jgi:hypothetical protein